jgi:glycosyltransferase involved in cell wall biosynthesis
MKITVILCTYNRCETLAKALETISASILPSEVPWEVLVVDNNSRDQTREVVEKFCFRYPGRFQYIFEPQPGKSYALNTGIREARGSVLAFTDDDVVVEPTWLQNLSAALDDGKWAGVGGRVLPEQTFSPPRWVPLGDRYALAPLAAFAPDLDAGPLNEAPFGANMAFQKRLFDKYGDFRTDLGPRPGSQIRSEDTEFGDRLLAAGELLFYEPSAIVYHSVPQHRVQKKYFLAWWFDKARADIRASGIPGDTKWFVAGIPLYLFRRLAAWTLRWLVATRPAERFSCKLKLWGVAGTILECFRQSLATTESPVQKGS